MSKVEAVRPQAWPVRAVGRVIGFIREVREEMQRVSWPTRDELIGSAIVVFVGVALLAAYISILDFFLSKTVQSLLR